VLIRGGGSNLDLACFDDYRLNFELSQSIFPVLTGIGHERDLSVSDMVAHTRLKTPTAVAEFIISHNLFFENKAISIFDSISLMAQEIIGEEKSIIENKSRFIAQYSRKQILNEVNELQQCSFHINKASLELLHQNHSILSQKKNHLYYASKREKEREEYDLKHFFNQFKAKINKTINKNTDDLGKNKTKLLNTRSLLINQNYTLNHLNHMIKLSKPENILKRGFSITRQNGKAITKLQNIKEQQEVETELYEGSFKSKIIKK
jgi:exodeoxyribonuclease VII large subunit